MSEHDASSLPHSNLPPTPDEESHCPQPLLERMRKVCAELSRLHHEYCCHTGLDPEGTACDELNLRWNPAHLDPDTMAEEMFQQYLKAASTAVPFRPGAVFCYACQSSVCEHAQPPTPEHVFRGYSFHGQAMWEKLYVILNELGEARIESLFTPQPNILAQIVPRSFIIAKQGIGGGRDLLTYRIMAQLICGYFLLDGERQALSIQVVEDAHHHLHLQLIASQELTDTMIESDSHHNILGRIYRAVRITHDKIRELDNSWHAATRPQRLKMRSKIFSILRHLSNLIERKGEQRRRRTDHAFRRQSQRRPIHMAIQDLQQTSTEDFFRDRFRKSIVVIGRSSRAHVFNQEGRHITSFILPANQLERRIQRKRYQPLSPEEIATLRQAVFQQHEDNL
ncbi:MAG: hypothetical protein D6820_05520 [Lentisphaerae bacterium]|nr:MAG: hypothetical protein D6820_05520 [Lentisphaerota bacterium]